MKNHPVFFKFYNITISIIKIAIISTFFLIFITFIYHFSWPNGARENSRGKTRETRIRLQRIDAMLTQYKYICGEFPSKLENLLNQSECQKWEPIKENEIYLNDPWKTPWFYQVKDKKVILKSLGNDKKVGGSGFNRDIDIYDD